MAFTYHKSLRALQRIDDVQDIELLLAKLRQSPLANEQRDAFPTKEMFNTAGLHMRLQFIREELHSDVPYLSGKQAFNDLSKLDGNIENYIGMTMVPTGIVGPLRVIGSAAEGDFFVPLATSEGALVASYHRGAKATHLAGGVRSVCLTEGVQRAPMFRFHNLGDLGTFVIWLLQQDETFKKIVSETSRFAQLYDIATNIEGNQLTLIFHYTTGDASGQNMVTICTDAVCKWIIENAPVKPVYWFIEGNFSGDKKATAMSFMGVRGKKVTAEVELPEAVVQGVLKTTPARMEQYWRSSTVGIIQTGSIGAQGHYANGLAALFIATGQDAACVSEASVGITRMEVTERGGLYAAVTLPNLIVGTVGGGTALPTQRECLELMGCAGVGHARKYAEIAGALVLAGELSIAASLSAGHFTSAHQKLGRKS